MGSLGSFLNDKGDHTSKSTDDEGQCPNCFKRGTMNWRKNRCTSCGAVRV